MLCVALFFLVLAFSFFKFGDISFLKLHLPEHYFKITSNEGWGSTFIWGFIAISTLINPHFYQRCFAAKSTATAKKGILISILIWFLFDICTTLGAMYAKALIPDAVPTKAYLNYAIQLLPNGLKGFFLAGVLSIILSTLDSYIFLAGTTLSYDIFPKNLKNKINLHYISILFVGLLSFSLSLIFKGNIKSLWIVIGSYSSACLTVPILSGLFIRNTFKDKDFIITSIASFFTTTLWFLIPKTSFLQIIDPIYIGMFTSMFFLGAFLLIKKKKC